MPHPTEPGSPSIVHAQFVTSQPHVRVEELTQDDEFLILASDGLWDVVSNEVGAVASPSAAVLIRSMDFVWIDLTKLRASQWPSRDLAQRIAAKLWLPAACWCFYHGV